MRADSGAQNHCVLVIHGTWNAPEDGETKWFQLDEDNPENFCRRLNDLLEPSPLGRAVWRTPAGVESDFGWPPANNDHEDRRAGAIKLANRILEIHKTDPDTVVHFVTHSHGGNILLWALEIIREWELWARYLANDIMKEAAQSLFSLDADAAADHVIRTRIDWPDSVLSADAHRGSQEFQRALGLLREILRSVHRKVHWKSQKLWLLKESQKLWLLKVSGIAEDAVMADSGRKAFEDAIVGLYQPRIGRIVFLGTPFYDKRWTVQKWSVSRVVFATIGNLTLGLAFLGAYYLMIVFWAIMLALLPFISFPGLNPVTWPWWLQVFNILGGIVLALDMLFGSYREREVEAEHGRGNGNLYYDPGSDDHHPFPALVIHASKLDEALLGMSALPLAQAYLLPRLRDVLEPRPWRSIPALARRRPLTAGTKSQRMRRWLAVKITSALAIPFLPIRRIASRKLEKYVVDRVLIAASSLALGVPAVEFQHAVVTAGSRLVDDHFDVKHVDVTKLLAGPILVEPAATVSQRYSFLWDDRELLHRLRESPTWQQARTSLRDVLCRDPRKPTRDVVQELRRTCVMADTRLEEFKESIKLAHSSYYSNPKIIEMIARFLAYGHADADESFAQRPSHKQQIGKANHDVCRNY